MYISQHFIKILGSLTLVFLFQSSNAQNNADKLLELFNIINLAYVDSFDGDELTEAAIVSMLEQLDPHSLYIPKDEVQEMNESLKGNYEGIGIQFNLFKDTVLVISPIVGGPASNLGIKPGDKIISAEGIVISGTGKTDGEIIELLKGEKGSQVNISIKRNGVDHLIDFLITREKIPIVSVDVGYMLNETTGYIKVNRFSRTTMTEFLAELNALKEGGMENLLLDLRSNGGGYLYSSVDMADQFINGKKTIVTTKGIRQSPHKYHSKSRGAYTKGKLIILINEGTASASEILAGAMQDLDRALIVGRRSFGKGLVMKPYTLSDGSMVRLTTSRYYTPSGRCIQKDYNTSKESYDDEINDRFENGELFSLDSISLPAHLKFYTSIGRTVYGGGGILPDVFIPADTVLLNDDFQSIFKSELLYNFSLEYVESNRKMLLKSYASVDSLLNDKSINTTLIEGINRYILKDSILSSALDSSYHQHIVTQIKAQISRYLWGDRSYHKAINFNQRIIKESLLMMKNEDFNWEDLSYYSK